MLARVYSVIFLAILVMGFIYQESYMQMTMSEFSQQVDADTLPLEIFSVSPLHVQQFKNSQLTGELKAGEGRLVTIGRFTASGSVRVSTFDATAPASEQISTVVAEKVVALINHKSGSGALDVFSGNTRFDRIEIPGQAEMTNKAHTLTGRAFSVDVPNMTLLSREPVTLTAVGRKLEAQGVELDLRTQAFKFTGPVRGTEIPPTRSEANKRSQQRRVNNKRL